MSRSIVVTTRLAEDDLTALDRLAAMAERSRSWVIERAIHRYVAEESAMIAFVQEGVDAIDRGDVHTQDEVEAIFGLKRDTRDAA